MAVEFTQSFYTTRTVSVLKDKKRKCKFTHTSSKLIVYSSSGSRRKMCGGVQLSYSAPPLFTSLIVLHVGRFFPKEKKYFFKSGFLETVDM